MIGRWLQIGDGKQEWEWETSACGCRSRAARAKAVWTDQLSALHSDRHRHPLSHVRQIGRKNKSATVLIIELSS